MYGHAVWYGTEEEHTQLSFEPTVSSTQGAYEEEVIDAEKVKIGQESKIGMMADRRDGSKDHVEA